MEKSDLETGALRPEQIGEIERCLARGWSWGVLTKLCNRKWGTDFDAQALRRCYARTQRLEQEKESRRDYYLAALEEGKE